MFPCLLSLSLSLCGCATTSPLKVPVRPAPMRTLAPPPPARLRIPVVVTLPQVGDVEKHIVNFLKEDWDKEAGHSLAKSLGTTVWWDPLDWKFKDNRLTAKMRVHAKGGKGESLVREAEKDIQVEVNSALEWGKNWRLEAPDFMEGGAATASAPEETDEKKSEKLLRKGTSKFHESLGKRTEAIETKAKDLWVEIQEPIRMAEDVWLQIIPHDVSVGRSRIIALLPEPRMESVFEVTIQPNVTVGRRPHPLKEELPPITEYKPGPQGFHIQTNLKISFKEVNKLLVDPKTGVLNRALPGGGSHNLRITGIDLYGSGGKLVVEAQVEYNPVVNLSGKPAKMTVYLVGTPTYHPNQRVIDFPDMDFDIKTSDFLVQMAEFFDGSGMKKQLRQQAVIPVGKSLDQLKQDLTQLLNRPLGHFARLKTDVKSLRMEEAFVSDYGIEGRVALDGDASVEVDW